MRARNYSPAEARCSGPADSGWLVGNKWILQWERSGIRNRLCVVEGLTCCG